MRMGVFNPHGWRRVARAKKVAKLKVRLLRERAEAREAELQRKHEAERDRNRRQAAEAERRIQAQRRRVGHLVFQLGQVPTYQYGSLTAGVPGWQELWQPGHGRRVLFWDPAGAAGLCMKLAAGLNETGYFAARVITLRQHDFGYPVDLQFPLPGLRSSELKRLIDECDLVQLMDESFFLDVHRPVPPGLEGELGRVRQWILDSGKPLVFSHAGGIARRFRDDSGYRRDALACAARIAWEPDLAYDWFDCHYVPHPVDVRDYPYTWRDGRLVGHSPSQRRRKGTEAFLEAVRGLNLDVDVIEGVTHAECLGRKQRCNLFFDQAGREPAGERYAQGEVIGWYGNSAIEAAANGIPTMVHMSRESFANARRIGYDLQAQCPLINVPTDAAGMRTVIAEHFARPPEDRAEIARRTRAWVERMHDIRQVAGQLEAIYTECLVASAPPRVDASAPRL